MSRMDVVEVIFEDPRWSRTGLEAWAKTAFVAVLDRLGLVASEHEYALLACDDARIAELNGDFRAKETPTNVLSWPALDLEPGARADAMLGDVAIAYETCAREAAEQGKSFEAHVVHLLVHALLHLLGYDHQTDAQAAQMEGLEVEILGKLGYADPY